MNMCTYFQTSASKVDEKFFKNWRLDSLQVSTFFVASAKIYYIYFRNTSCYIVITVSNCVHFEFYLLSWNTEKCWFNFDALYCSPGVCVFFSLSRYPLHEKLKLFKSFRFCKFFASIRFGNGVIRNIWFLTTITNPIYFKIRTVIQMPLFLHCC